MQHRGKHAPVQQVFKDTAAITFKMSLTGKSLHCIYMCIFFTVCLKTDNMYVSRKYGLTVVEFNRLYQFLKKYPITKLIQLTENVYNYYLMTASIGLSLTTTKVGDTVEEGVSESLLQMKDTVQRKETIIRLVRLNLLRSSTASTEFKAEILKFINTCGMRFFIMLPHLKIQSSGKDCFCRTI